MKTKKCKACSAEIPSSAKVCPSCGAKNKKPVHKKWWFWAIIVWLLLGIISLVAGCSLLMKGLSNLDPSSITLPTFNSLEPSTAPIEKPTTPPTEKPTEGPVTIFDAYVGKPLDEFMKKVTESGYTATYTDQGTDITDVVEWIADAYMVGELKEDPIAKTVTVEIISKSSIDQEAIEKALSEKLEVGAAWIAAQHYGEDQYGSSFELHYYMGQIAAEAEDENTWFLKATCTVFGVDMVCEAKVTGTSDNPKVISFTVY